MKKIGMLLTITPWKDMRPYYWQAPAFLREGYEVIYFAGESDGEITLPLKYIALSKRERRLARFTGALNLFFKVIKNKPTVLQLLSVEGLPLGLALKLFTNIKVTYDCREDMFNSMRFSKEKVPVPVRILLAYATRFLEYLAALTFDGIIASDPAIYRTHRNMPENKKSIFYNTPLLSQFTGNFLPLPEREFDLAFLGSMGRRSGFFVLLEIIRLLHKKGIQARILLIGSPKKKLLPHLKKTLTELDMEGNVTITGYVDHKVVPQILSKAKIGLVLLLDDPKFHNNIACKAFEYMACGMPVVSSDLPPERLFIQENVTGAFFRPGDAREAADKIELLLQDLTMAQKIGECGRHAVESKWNCENNQKELLLFYRKILATPDDK